MQMMAIGRPALTVRLSIREVRQPHTRYHSHRCQSYASCTIDAVLCSAKQGKYLAADEERRATITPFVVSVKMGS